MKKKRELLERRDALKNDMKAQLDAFQALEDGPSAEQWEGYNAKKAELEAVDAKLASIEQVEEEVRSAGTSLEAQSVSNSHNRAEDKPWASFGEQLQAIAGVELNHEVDPRLRRQSLAPSGASTQVGADGGFLIQEDFSTALLNRATEQAVIAPRCTTIPLSGAATSVKLPTFKETSRATGSRWGGVRVYRRNEGDTVTASKVEFDRLRLEVEPMMALAYASEEMLSMPTVLEATFEKAFTSEFAFVIDDEIIRGNGAGECLGVLSAPCLVSQGKQVGQSAATIVSENISKMWTRVPAKSKTKGAWFINSEITDQLDSLNIAVGTGGALVYMPPNGLSGAPYGTIKGRPIVEIEQASALGTAGDIMFADFSEYLLVTKGGLKGDQSMHVRFIYNEQAFRWTYQINGQPAWLSALTPYKGSATKSPFVVLENR